ncbi:MAG: hypothetical protein FDX02_05485 [Chlorobium sp.]|nr:MAG: hypothetical protein FDX02_05485 [Chlorobium sp.]
MNSEVATTCLSFSIDVDRRVSAVGYPGGNSLAIVAKKLTAELPGDLARLYAIYRWITTYIEYDVDAYFSGDLRNAVGAANTFHRGKAVCEGYSALFQEMGGVAGLKIEKVDGYAKGYGYAVGVMTGRANHAWNAVNLDGHWYLLDSTWDAGSIDDSCHFSRKSGKWNYFLVDPQFFITSHFPENPAWQLLPKPVTRNTFLDMASVPPGMIDLGVDMSKHSRAHIEAAVAPYLFDFGAGVQQLSGRLRAGSQEVKGAWALQLRQPDNHLKLLFSAPKAGDYVATVFVAEKSTDTKSSEAISYDITFSDVASYPKGFPFAFTDYYAHHVVLVEPLSGVVPAGKLVRFRLKSDGAQAMMIVQHSKPVAHLLLKNGYFTGDVTFSPGEAGVFANYSNGNSYAGLLNYQVE